jgi:hypothetical protein
MNVFSVLLGKILKVECLLLYKRFVLSFLRYYQTDIQSSSFLFLLAMSREIICFTPSTRLGIVGSFNVSYYVIILHCDFNLNFFASNVKFLFM